MTAELKFNMRGWNELVSEILNTEGVDRMTRVADAANFNDETTEYMTSVEGDNPLRKRDYRVTVITAGPKATVLNRRRRTLLRCFYLAGD